MELTEIKEALLQFFATDLGHLWIVDDRVYYDGDWDDFKGAFDSCNADLLATVVRTRNEDPKWNWWNTLKRGNETVHNGMGVAALLPLMRVSRHAATAILSGIESGWSGHPEALLPTLVNLAGLSIEDIGGNGSFTPEHRQGRWYHAQTWNWCGPVVHVPTLLHFPVPKQRRALAPARLSPSSVTKSSRILYVSPVGRDCAELLENALKVFQDAKADVILLMYEDVVLDIPSGVRVIREVGYKWQLAEKCLHPDMLEDYDFIFFWDDDLDVRGFDPERFVRIMQLNRVDIAQPSIQSNHGISHDITKHRASPPPWRDRNGRVNLSIVGRLTNFVEIMAPVFTRDAWREFYGYLDVENRSGWGYDFIPVGRKGIVDVMPVVHTRAVQSINPTSEAESRRFAEDQGLILHMPVDQGWLFEEG